MKSPQSGSASFITRAPKSLSLAIKKNKDLKGQSTVMPFKYKNCHMRLDRFACNSYGEYNGVALDGLPHHGFKKNAVLTTPHTTKNMFNSLQPKFERLNPANEIAIKIKKDITASSSEAMNNSSREVTGFISHRSGPATE